MTAIKYPNRGLQTGMTLIELLIAIAIISLLAGIALPALKTTLKSQRVSQGASLLQATFEQGRALSIARGGGGGVVIDRLGVESLSERSQAVRLRFATGAGAYRGEYNSTARYQYIADGLTIGPIDNPNGPRNVTGLPAVPGNPFRDYHVLLFNESHAQIIRSAEDIAAGEVPTLVNIGDVIRVGDAGIAGRIRRIIKLTNSGSTPNWPAWLALAKTAAEPAPFTYSASNINFQYVMVEFEPLEPNTDLRSLSGRDIVFSVRRTPRPAIALPLDLPSGVAIDLTASGIGRYGNDFSPMFIAGGNYIDTSMPPFTVPAGPPSPTSITPNDYESVIVIFGSRGEVSRVFAASGLDSTTQQPNFQELGVTGDLHFLVGETGQVKTDPQGMLELDDADWANDREDDGTTPLLNSESIWVSINVRTGKVSASPWINPTPDDSSLIPSIAGTVTNQKRQNQIQTVIGLTRSAAIEGKRVKK